MTPTGARSPRIPAPSTHGASEAQRSRRDDHQRRDRHRGRPRPGGRRGRPRGPVSRTTRRPRCGCRPPRRRSTICGCGRRSTTPSTARASSRLCSRPGTSCVTADSVRRGRLQRPSCTLWPHDADKAKQLVAEAKADGVPVDRQIRSSAAPRSSRTSARPSRCCRASSREIGLNVKIEMMDTSNQLLYQLRPFPEDAGPYLLMIMHGNQAGDAAFTMDQYMLSDGAAGFLRHTGIRQEDRRPPKRSPAQQRQDAFAKTVRRRTQGDRAASPTSRT